jgi:hypothetical protein
MMHKIFLKIWVIGVLVIWFPSMPLWALDFEMVRRNEITIGTSVDLLRAIRVYPPGGLSGGLPSRIVTAARNQTGVMELRVIDITSNGQLRHRGSAVWGVVSEIAMTDFDCCDGFFVTAVRNRHGVLRVLLWRVSDDGIRIELAGDATDVTSTKIDVTNYIQGVITAASTPTLNDNGLNGTRLVRWSIANNGRIRLREIEQAGFVHDIQLVKTNVNLYSVLRNKNGRIRLIYWSSDPFDRLKRSGEGRRVDVIATPREYASGSGWQIVGSIDPGPTGVRTGPSGGGRLLVQGGRVRITRFRQRENDPFRKVDQVSIGGTGGIGIELDIAWLHRLKLVSAHTGYSSFKPVLAKNRGKPEVHIIGWKLDDSDFAGLEKPKRAAALTIRGRFHDLNLVNMGSPRASENFAMVARDGNGRIKVIHFQFQLVD